MTRFGLGIELDPVTVRWAAQADLTGEPIGAELPPVVVIVDGTAVAGAAAVAAMHDHVANVVADVVGQFPVDRLWFSGGLMLTPDDAMRTILAGCAADATRRTGDVPGAVTVACPGSWDEPHLDRIGALLDGLGLPSPSVRRGLPVTLAAADAATRIEQPSEDPSEHPDLPALPASARRAPRDVSAELPGPIAATVKRRRLGRWAWVAVVVGIPVVVIVAVRAWTEPVSPSATAGRPAASTVAAGLERTPATPATTAPPPALTIGVLTATGSATEVAVRAEVDAIAADPTGPAGQMFVVVHPPDPPAEAIDQMLGQGVTALIGDAAGAATGALVEAARPGGLPLCLVGDAPELEAVRGRGIAVGNATTCTQFLVLAAVSAQSTLPARLADAASLLIGGSGVECRTVSRCAALLDASQPISFEPDGGPIRLAPPSEDADP